jgi:hypothetical protein
VAVQFGSGPSAGSGSPNSSDSSNTAKGCGIVVALLILLDLLQAFVQCIVQWANKKTCTFWDNMLLKKVWEQDPPDPRDPTHPENPGVSSAQLTAAASSPQLAQLVWMLFDVHSQAWEALDRAYIFLAVTGLIYPQRLLTTPVYAQFTSLPAPSPWPHREPADDVDVYHLYPVSPLEDPTEAASTFATGSLPDAYVQAGQANGPAVSLELWKQIALGAFDSVNRDLDADRGFEALCWAVRGSVTTDPIDVVTLTYAEQ